MDYSELFSREYIPAHSDVPESAESILIAMGARNGHFDIEKFKKTGAGEAAARMMENTLVNVDEHSPESVSFWAKRGMVKEFHGEDVPMDWEAYLATHPMEDPFDPGNTFPQNLVKKWTSFVPVSAFEPGNTRKYPLVFVLHGAGNTVYAIDSWGFVDSAAAREWIVIAPSLECGEVIGEILKEAAELYPVDLSRVYVAGFSYGSRNTNFLAAEHPEWVAAAAPCGGFLKDPYQAMYPAGMPKRPGPQEPRYACTPREDFFYEMPIMTVMGNCDGFPFPVYDSNDFESMADALRYWGKVNHTKVPSKEEILALKDQTKTMAETYLGLPLDTGCSRVETDRGTDFAIGDFKDENGVTRIRVVCEDNHPHWPTPHLSELVFDFFDCFARDPETGKSIVRG